MYSTAGAWRQALKAKLNYSAIRNCIHFHYKFL